MRFALVGISGVGVNLAALHVLAAGLGVPEIAASALAIEASVVSNFLLNDTFTFRDRHGAGGAGRRLLRYHAVSAVGVIVQLGTFTALALGARRLLGRPALGPWRSAAQLAGIALAFAWSYAGSVRFAWAGHARARARPPRRASRAAAVPAAIFAALLVLHALPTWLVAYVPTQDGPLHVENTLALLHHATSPLLQRYYVANWGAQPNWLTQLLLAPLLGIVSAPTAEKLVLTGYTLLLPLSFRAVLPRGARGWWAALAVFPFVHAFPFFMGFWNFSWGLALAFLTAGFYLRTRGRLSPARFAGLAALSALLYLAHLVAFVGAVIAAAAVLGLRAWASVRRAGPSSARRRRVLRGYGRRLAAGALTFAPGIALVLAWVVAHRDRASARLPFPELAAKLAAGYALVSIDRGELPLAVMVVLVLFVGVVHLLLVRAGRGPTLRPNDGWLLAAAIFVVLYFAVPDVVAAGAYVSDRLALFAFLCTAAWIGAGAAPRVAVRRVALALAAISVVALGVRLDKERRLSALMEELVSAGRFVGNDRVILPLALAPHGPRDAHGRRMGYRIKPFLHGASWIVAAQGGVELKNSQANTDQCPVRWPADRNPFRIIASNRGRMEGVPPCVDLRAAPRLGTIDYVLVWGATRENLETPCGAALVVELADRYEPVFLSAPRGLLEVWRPRAATAGRRPHASDLGPQVARTASPR
ncbi:GtrA family protein [Anaeromyxobacter oryzisoli]|uniref:GtrA family protein n=1 Tax=Anaeromyxobacter oryzisoli TaxID=2925408 RepID=UPI001F58FA3F|nr:GtrA family protein [Anaeromyxobacter sp. SG63]